MLGHAASMKTMTKMMVMLVMPMPCFGNIYHEKYMWVVCRLKSMIDFEQAQGS